jgi:hypothetical protein
MVRRRHQRVYARLPARYGAVSNHEASSFETHPFGALLRMRALLGT